MFDYSRKLEKSEVLVHLFCDGDKIYKSKLLEGEIASVADRYGFSFEYAEENLIEKKDKYIIALLICCTDSSDVQEFVNKAIKWQPAYNFISLAFAYPNYHAMNQARSLVDFYKKKYKKLNFLRPDSFDNGYCYVSNQKLSDNAVCDSIRIKYNPECIDNSNISISQEVKDFFTRASEVYKNFSLFHRAPSDGYFAIRVGEGFVITATKTNKYTFDLNRLSYVRKYDQKTNRLFYQGPHLPSSDSVEAAIIFNKLPNIQTLIHTHASDLFTRSPKYSHRVKVPVLPYGECLLGCSIVDALKQSEDGFIIMAEHGEIFASDLINNPREALNKVVNHCEEALKVYV